jgi:hypothetical protein
MKTLNYYLLCILALAFSAKSFTQANTGLSNLAKTSVNRNLDPKSTNAINLGASDSSWKNLFLTGSIYLDKKRFVYNPGTNNNFVGTLSGNSSTTGSDNTGFGFNSLYSDTTGSGNTAVGASALFSNTGSYNTATGYAALNANTDGFGNTAFGLETLVSNTTADYNTAIGVDAMYHNTAGFDNTAAGAFAMFVNTGNYNTGLGVDALEATTGALYNTAVGFEAGGSYNNGYNNVFVGANTDVNGTDYYNDIAIGHGTICTDVSQARIGNSYTNSIGGYADWTNISDGRVKKNIKQNVPGLAFINKLAPITYNLDLDAADKIIQPPPRKDATGKLMQPTQYELEARKAKEQVIYTGFVAQDIEKAAKSLNYDFSGVDAAKNDKDLYGLRYAEFVVPLVKAVQELSQQNDAQRKINSDLQKQIDELKAMIASNQSTLVPLNTGANNQQSAVISSASLEQNIPNPFNHTTTIGYSLPNQFSSAQIIITDKNGRQLKQINISRAGKGTITVDALTLASGAYNYALYADGKLIASKQMELIK